MQQGGMRIRLRMELKRQIDQGQGEDGHVPHAELSGEEVGVKVPDKKNRLEKHEAGKPDMGSSAEVGRQQPSCQGLQSEEQNGSHENHARKHNHG
jgi:hypothetical protein